MPRNLRTPAQRAQDQLAAAKRRHDKAVKTEASARTAAATAVRELEEARSWLEYCEHDPRLPVGTDPTPATTPAARTGRPKKDAAQA